MRHLRTTNRISVVARGWRLCVVQTGYPKIPTFYQVRVVVLHSSAVESTAVPTFDAERRASGSSSRSRERAPTSDITMVVSSVGCELIYFINPVDTISAGLQV